MPEPVIVSTARSPIGRAFKGSMVDLRPDDLAATIVQAAMDQVPQVTPDMITDLHLGCGLPGGEQGFNMGRVVSTLLGWEQVPGLTLTRYCSSSLQTTRMAAHAIRAGEGDVFVSAGVEMVSRFTKGNSDSLPDTQNPRFDEARARTKQMAEDSADEWVDPTTLDRLPDIYIPMGQTAENVANLRGITREEQDDFAYESQTRYAKAKAEGFWENEITPIELPDGSTMTEDDSPRQPDRDKMGELAPVFRPEGTVTAGNACPLNDGAAAVVVMSDTKAEELGIEPLARIVSTGVTALNPEIMGLGPVGAIQQALGHANMTIGDIDLVEINEAFAAQVIPSARDLGIDFERLNPHGGSIACGHPFGMTGARITGTLLNGLQHTDGTYGIEAMCVGGGQGMAMVVERLR
jgi:acetyl-CoA C-acetyltransferase